MAAFSESEAVTMIILEPEMVLAIATLFTAFLTVIWSIRRKR